MELFQDNWITATIAGAITSILTWVLSKRQRNANAAQKEGEVMSSELDQVQVAIGIYRKAAEDLSEELRTTREANEALRKINEKLYTEIRSQSVKLSEQGRHIKSIERKLERYQKERDDQRKENQQLRQRLDRLDPAGRDD